METQVLKFINDFKKQHPAEIEDTFLHGYCYWFAMILNSRFGVINTEIYYLPIQNHFITKIKDKFYDITGEVIPDEKPYLWCIYAMTDMSECKRIIRDCILKEDIEGE